MGGQAEGDGQGSRELDGEPAHQLRGSSALGVDLAKRWAMRWALDLGAPKRVGDTAARYVSELGSFPEDRSRHVGRYPETLKGMQRTSSRPGEVPGLEGTSWRSHGVVPTHHAPERQGSQAAHPPPREVVDGAGLAGALCPDGPST